MTTRAIPKVKVFGLITLALVVGCVTVASAAVTLRTFPFPGGEVSSGSVRCLARNGGSAIAPNVKVNLFAADGTVLMNDTLDLGPSDADRGTAVQLGNISPSMCECTVPSNTLFTCSLVYVNGPIQTVVPSQ